jgi:hypothetical protein
MKNKSFLPPKKVRKVAERGLELRNKFKRGGLSSRIAGKLGIGSGIVRATNLASGKRVSYRTVKRMKAYFSRHHKDKRQGWDNENKPSNGYIAWMLWEVMREENGQIRLLKMLIELKERRESEFIFLQNNVL